MHLRSSIYSLPLALVLAGGGAFNFTPAASGQVNDLVYQTNQTDYTISGWVFDSSTHKLTPADGSPFSSGVQPYQMVVTQSRDFLYTVMGEQPPGVRGGNCLDLNTEVTSYAIDHANGSLHQRQTITLNGYCAYTGLAVSPSGHLLYVGETDSTDTTGMIDVVKLDGKGNMELVPGSPFVSPQTPTALVLDGNYIFAANNNTFGTNGLLIFKRDPSNGTVEYLSGIKMAPQQGVAVASSMLYSVGGSTITKFKVNSSTGALTPSGTVNVGSGAVQIATGPKGHYAAVAANNGVNLYSIGTSGGLTRVGSPLGGGASWVMFDSTGAHLVALQSKINVYSLSNNTAKVVASAEKNPYAATVTMTAK